MTFRTVLFRSIAAAALLLLSGAGALAQFTPGGGEPARLRWYSIESPNYKVIYPSGADSLAKAYAEALERIRAAEAPSIGFLPGGGYKAKTPVILHTLNGDPNGSVTWAPRRMDLYTVPEAYGSDPHPWVSQLAVHESRHLAQMQFGYAGAFRPFGWLLGEMWQGALSAVYPNQALLEGDAVVAETALTPAGRGRTAEFLAYYRAAFDAGDWRDWYKWRYGSFRHYAPDHYTTGYMTVAGMRFFHDDPLFMKEYFERVIRHPLHIGNLQKTVRNVSGKRFREAYRDIMEGFHEIWTEEAAARGPVMPSEQITPSSTWFTEYTGNVMTGDRHYVLRSALNRPLTLEHLHADGSTETLGAFPSSTSSLFYAPAKHRIYWSETVPDRRWNLKKSSVIRYIDIADGSRHDLTREGRYYNPHTSPDDSEISVVEYPVAGGSRIVVLDADDGSVLRSLPVPDSLQATESAWLGDRIYFFAVSGRGFGMYSIPDDLSSVPKQEIAPAVVKMQNIAAGGDSCIEFVSDLDGYDEFYCYRPESGKLFRMTTTRYGGADFAYNAAGDSLYYSALTAQGKLIFRTAAKDLVPREVDMSAVHRYPVADRLSEQEVALGSFDAEYGQPEISAPFRYGKFSHLLHLHSWAPVFVNYDSIESQSMDLSYHTASPGLTGFFQNALGTFYGYAGYSAHRDPFGPSWRHSGHAKFTYRGLYPVIEASVDFNDRDMQQIYGMEVVNGSLGYYSMSSRFIDIPYVTGSIETYIPLNFSKGGWQRGLIPRARYSFSNDMLNTAAAMLSYGEYTEGSSPYYMMPEFTGTRDGHNVPVQRLSFSVRAYTMRPAAQSQTYPSAGIGAELGFSIRPGLASLYNPAMYAYLYGYLPGIVPHQGLKLTAMMQHRFDKKGLFAENIVSFMPRGFGSSEMSVFGQSSPTQFKVTADYAVPVYVGDLSFLSPLAYIKNFELEPFFDFAVCGKNSLYSFGTAVTAKLGNLLWIPFDSAAGFRIGRTAGSSNNKFFAEAIFSIDL